jgi:hypothetical protein
VKHPTFTDDCLVTKRRERRQGIEERDVVIGPKLRADVALQRVQAADARERQRLVVQRRFGKQFLQPGVSASSSRSRFASLACMPPNLARHL